MNERNVSVAHTHAQKKAKPAIMGIVTGMIPQLRLTHGTGGGGCKKAEVMCVYGVCGICADARDELCKMISIVHTGIPMTMGWVVK